MSNIITYFIEWRHIDVEIVYDPDCSHSFREFHSRQLAHIIVNAAQPLPISETGYLSRFIQTDFVDEAGGVIVLVMEALDHAAKNRNWKEKQAMNIQLQLSLF